MTFIEPKLNLGFIKIKKISQIVLKYSEGETLEVWWQLKIFNKTWKLFKKEKAITPPPFSTTL